MLGCHQLRPVVPTELEAVLPVGVAAAKRTDQGRRLMEQFLCHKT